MVVYPIQIFTAAVAIFFLGQLENFVTGSLIVHESNGQVSKIGSFSDFSEAIMKAFCKTK